MGRIFVWFLLSLCCWSGVLARPSQPSPSHDSGWTGGYIWPSGFPWPWAPHPTQPQPPAPPPAEEPKPPVCIIGAGPSGLTAANRLEGKGYETVIFDKQPEIGGKCQSYYENDTFHPLGAAFYSNASYPETIKVIDASGVSSVPFFLADSGRLQYNFNWTTGQITPVSAPSGAFMVLLMTEIPRYIGMWNILFAPLSVPSFKNGVPDNLTVTGTEWFAKNNFVALPLLLVDPLALYGYGDIRQVPILYILQYITPDILTAFVGLHSVYLADFHKIWVDWSKKSIKGTIHTNTNIVGIDRSGSQPVIKFAGSGYKRNDKSQQKCSSIILAFPPTLENLKNAGFDITAAENEVFSTVGVNNYYSAAVNFRLPYNVSYIGSSVTPAVPPPNEGEPVALLDLQPTSRIATSWSWGPYRQFQSEETARQLLQSTLSKINKDPRDMTAMSVAVTNSDIRAFRKWDYFPRFDGPDLKNGAYAKYNALQGQKKTFYASGLNGMETVEWAIRGAQDVANSYF